MPCTHLKLLELFCKPFSINSHLKLLGLFYNLLSIKGQFISVLYLPNWMVTVSTLVSVYKFLLITISDYFIYLHSYFTIVFILGRDVSYRICFCLYNSFELIKFYSGNIHIWLYRHGLLSFQSDNDLIRTNSSA